MGTARRKRLRVPCPTSSYVRCHPHTLNSANRNATGGRRSKSSGWRLGCVTIPSKASRCRQQRKGEEKFWGGPFERFRPRSGGSVNTLEFSTRHRLRRKRDPCGETLIAGRQFCRDMPARVEYRSHVYENGDGRFGLCLM